MTTLFRSVNPKNNKLLRTFENISGRELQAKVDRAYERFRYKYRQGFQGLPRRYQKLGFLKEILKERREEIAVLITREMGKPLSQSYGEVDKSITHIEYYQNQCDEILEPVHIDLLTGQSATIIHQPLGPILTVQPWNYPFWNPMKAVIPPLLLGNSIILKHSHCVPQIALMLQEIFNEAGFGKGEFANVFINHAQVEQIVSDRRLRGVKFMGSAEAGKRLAQLAGRHMKKATVECGGNDPFIVLKEADLELAVDKAYQSRMLANGQGCMNAKRFIVTEPIYHQFKEALIEKIKSTTVIGDPMDPEVNLGPISTKHQLQELKGQIDNAIKNDGCKIAYGDPNYEMKTEGLTNGNYFAPMILEHTDYTLPSAHEEFFGPVFNLFMAKSQKQSLDIANASDYGLAAAIFTKNEDKLEHASNRLRTGTVFLNESSYTASDYPSGGIKNSGFGKECYSDGLIDMSNRKVLIRGDH